VSYTCQYSVHKDVASGNGISGPRPGYELDTRRLIPGRSGNSVIAVCHNTETRPRSQLVGDVGGLFSDKESLMLTSFCLELRSRTCGPFPYIPLANVKHR
jgi:hypothetical protein